MGPLLRLNSPVAAPHPPFPATCLVVGPCYPKCVPAAWACRGQPAAPLQVDCARICILTPSPSAPGCLRSAGVVLCILPRAITRSGTSPFWRRWLAATWGPAGDPLTVRFGVRNLGRQGGPPEHVIWASECGVAGSPPHPGSRLSGPTIWGWLCLRFSFGKRSVMPATPVFLGAARRISSREIMRETAFGNTRGVCCCGCGLGVGTVSLQARQALCSLGVVTALLNGFYCGNWNRSVYPLQRYM